MDVLTDGWVEPLGLAGGDKGGKQQAGRQAELQDPVSAQHSSPHLGELPALGPPTSQPPAGRPPCPPAYSVPSLHILRFEASCSALWLPQKPWLRVEMSPIQIPSPPSASRQSQLESYLLASRSWAEPGSPLMGSGGRAECFGYQVPPIPMHPPPCL